MGRRMYSPIPCVSQSTELTAPSAVVHLYAIYCLPIQPCAYGDLLMTPSPLDNLKDLPLHHLIFLKVRDGGGPRFAHSVAELHGISVDTVKAYCRQAAIELIQERGHLLPYEEPVQQWAES
jgi:hypothetical protein